MTTEIRTAISSTRSAQWRTPTGNASSPAAGGAWRHRHLLGLHGMDAASLRAILGFAARIPLVTGGGAAEIPRRDDLRGRTVATLFFEDSTRTRTSFTIAAQRLGADVVDLSGGTTSINKGETIVDTATNVEAMGIDAIIVRARQSGAAAMAAEHVQCPVINAGDGRHEHPTQGLLDILTIAEAHGRGETFDLSGLTIAIVGDVASSRVARSAIAGLTTLGADVVAIGPAGMVSPAHASLASPGATGRCRIDHDLDAVIGTADAVMMLRIQFERAGDGATAGSAVAGVPAAKKSNLIPSVREYRHGYAMTVDRAARMKDGAIVMHPGPMNRGLEIDGEVADGPRSVILRQVSNGVRVRMAALALCHAAAKTR
ncbi:MAG: aspartate carbamoyltransferase catalytic subunit [Phycisphaerales bacterium]|nr:aspartate carbamoyltransferase catalytic subunit [Phycisphaerales bacterium]